MKNNLFILTIFCLFSRTVFAGNIPSEAQWVGFPQLNFSPAFEVSVPENFAPQYECQISYTGTIQNGLGDLLVSMAANDFEVAANSTMAVDKFSLRIYRDISTANVQLFEDNNGQPGTMIASYPNLTPTSQTLDSTTPGGVNIYEVVFEFPVVELEGGDEGKLFWIAMGNTTAGTEGGQNFWEMADTITNNLAYVSFDGGGTWATNPFGQDSAFTVYGECEGGEPQPEECEISYTGSIQNGLGDLLVSMAANDFEVAANSTMAVDKFSLRIYRDISTANVQLFEDNNGQPGTMIASYPNLAPTSQTLDSTTPGGVNIYEVVFEFPVVELDGGDEGKLFWIAMGNTTAGTEGGQNFWEMADTITNNLAYVSFDGGGTWALNPFGQDGAFTVYGICEGEGGGDPDPDPTPENDECEDAIAVSCGDYLTGTTNGANDSGGNSTKDVFYTFTGDGTTQLVTVSLCGSSYDTVLRIFSDCTLGEEITWADEGCGTGLSSKLNFVSDGTSTYIIMVEGHDTYFGDFVMNVSCQETVTEAESCEDQFVPSNELENGYFFDGTGLGVDIPVGDTPITVYGVKPVFAGNATYATINIYDDINGRPGFLQESYEGNITDEEFVGNNFGMDFYAHSIYFDEPLELEANTTYWLEIYTDAWGWESTSQFVMGTHSVIYDGVYWQFTNDEEFVYSLICEAEEMGTSDLNSFDFSYYPNPVKDILNLNSKKNIEKVSVFNLAGQKVSENMKIQNGKIDMKNLPAGTYVFKVQLENGQIETFKIIKN